MQISIATQYDLIDEVATAATSSLLAQITHHKGGTGASTGLSARRRITLASHHLGSVQNHQIDWHLYRSHLSAVWPDTNLCSLCNARCAYARPCLDILARAA
jgi:hypothetical protein